MTHRIPPPQTLRRRLEKGGVATIVAVLLGGGVLLGAGALAVDVGNIMFERRQLQNGADASAMALATACAENIADCTNGNPVVQKYNNANAKDDSSSNDGVCGRNAGGLTECPSATDDSVAQAAAMADLAKCPPLAPWLTQGSGAGISYVEVRTGTSTGGSNPTVLPAFLSRAVTGTDNPHYVACARAAWGPPGGGTATIPVTFSQCEYENAVPPAVDWDTVTALSFNYSNDAECQTWNGHDFAGSFGWLDHDSECKVDVNLGWAHTDTGIGAANDCGAWIESQVGKTVYLPIFDCMDDISKDCISGEDLPNGQDAYYRLVGKAAFKLLAVDVTGQMKASALGFDPNSSPYKEMCLDKGGFCFWGYFLNDWKDIGAEIDPNAEDFGGIAVQPAG